MAIFCNISGVKICDSSIAGLHVRHPLYDAISIETLGKSLDRWENLSEDDKRLAFTAFLTKIPILNCKNTSVFPAEALDALIFPVASVASWLVRRSPQFLETLPRFVLSKDTAKSFMSVFSLWVKAKEEHEADLAKAKATHQSRQEALAKELEFDDQLVETASLEKRFETFMLTEHWMQKGTFNVAMAKAFLDTVAIVSNAYAKGGAARDVAIKILTTPFAKLELSSDWKLADVYELQEAIAPGNPEFSTLSPLNMRKAADTILADISYQMTGNVLIPSKEFDSLEFDDIDFASISTAMDDMLSAKKEAETPAVKIGNLELPTIRKPQIDKATIQQPGSVTQFNFLVARMTNAANNKG